MTMKIRIFCVPQNIWNQKPLSDLVEDALVAERRIRKNSNLDIERRRYSQICTLIESFININYPDNSIVLDEIYLDHLYQIYQVSNRSDDKGLTWEESRASKSFFPPFLVKENARAFKKMCRLQGLMDLPDIQQRSDFIEKSGGQNEKNLFGFVEILETDYTAVQSKNPTSDQKKIPNLETDHEDKRGKKFDSFKEDDFLVQIFDSALKDNLAVNLSNPFHPQITETLREFSYNKNNQEKKFLRILYADGSESEPFPLFHLVDNNENNNINLDDYPDLKVSLLSMRHLDQDVFVNMAWLNNQQASSTRQFAETEKFCLEKTIEQLDEMAKPIKIILYQTGLQPAIVGFFRGLILWKLNNLSLSNQVIVVPYYHQKRTGSYEPGQIWF